MNSSQIAKRTIPVLIVILLVIGAAVLASVLNKDKLVPSITDEDGVYLTISEGDRSFNISKKYMYDELKSNVGLRMLLNTIDKHLLENEKKGDSNYLASVSEDEIDEAIDEEAFSAGKEGLTTEEIESGYEEYYRSLYVSAGLRTKEEVRDHHRLEIAKRLYASDKLQEEIDLANKLAEENKDLDPYFKDSKFETKYKADYLPAYWAIIIPFQSKIESELALKQVGLEVDEDSKSGSYANLVRIGDEDKEKLSPTEIAKAFIEMYNTFYSHLLEDYPNTKETLVEGVHYRINEDGELVFNSVIEENEDMNKLHLTNEEVAKINKQAENFLKGMLSYSATSTENKWYTAEPRVYDSKLYVYMLKIKVETVPSIETVWDEIYESLFEEELTANYITKKLIELRELNNLEILDPNLESEYLKLVAQHDLDFKKTKAEDQSVVAKVKGLEITADTLFNQMDKFFGLSLVASEVNYLRFLNSLELNKIYDYHTPNLKTSERILNREKWEEIRTATVNEKNIFLSGGYQSFPPNYGWKNFLRDYYGVSNVEELMYTLLYTKLRSEFASSLLEVDKLTEDSQVWQDVLTMMEKVRDEYFSVNGLQILISVKDKDGKYVPEADWTDLQKDYAKELYADVWDYIGGETGDYEAKLNTLVNRFKDAPRFLASLDQELSVQPELEGNPYVFEEEELYSINLSKYKTAGLNIEFLKVSSLTNKTEVSDTTPERLKEVAKEIFKSLPQGSTEIVRYGYTFGSDEYEYLISETGYHVYINTSTVENPSWKYTNEEEKHVLPTLEMIKTIAKDNAADKLIDLEGNKTEIEFTSAMKSAVTKYFDPIKNEITGSTNVLIKLYRQMQDIGLDFKVKNYSNEEFNSFLDRVIEIYEENLTYINVEE